jgi:hypothetical protein
MKMPTGQDYVEALQNPAYCFVDVELKDGTVETDVLGLPRPRSGNFASVFHITVPNGRAYAVRCFIRYFADQQERYNAISAHLSRIKYPWQVEFVFQESGIRIMGRQLPIVKMEWIEGEQLNRYVARNLGAPRALLDLASRFASLVRDLEAANVAHGDLQHGNILVTSSGELKLVDYDGMYVPSLTGRTSHELGHRHYQHPKRTDRDFGPHIDRFSAWLIYASLVALAIDPSLWDRLDAGEEFLLFKRSDFNGGGDSAFAEIQFIGDAELERLAERVRELARSDLRAIPALAEVRIELPEPLGDISFDSAGSGLPDWLADSRGEGTPVEAAGIAAGVEWMADHLAPLASVELETVGSFPKRLAATVAVIVAAIAAVGGLGLVSLASALGGGGVVLLLSLGVSRLFFGRLPQVIEKRRLAVDLGAHEARVRGADAALVLHQRDARRVAERESKLVEAARRDHKKVKETEQKELQAAAEQHRGNLASIAKTKQNLQKSEVAERDAKLAAAREAAIKAALASRTIAAARLQGISGQVLRDLERMGFRTAADFSSVVDAYISYGRYRGTRTAHLVRPNGQRVKVRGIGAVRGQRLQVWRNRVESDARHRAPKTLPASVAQQIKAKYAAESQRLARDEHAAAMNAKRLADAARRRSADSERRVGAKLKQDRAEVRKEQEALASKIADARKSLADAHWELASARRRVRAYDNVTFTRFLIDAAGLPGGARGVKRFASSSVPAYVLVVLIASWLAGLGYLVGADRLRGVLGSKDEGSSAKVSTRGSGGASQGVAIPGHFARLGVEFKEGASLVATTPHKIILRRFGRYDSGVVALQTRISASGGRGDHRAMIGAACRIADGDFYALGVTGANEARILKVADGLPVVLFRRVLPPASGGERGLIATCIGNSLGLTIDGREVAAVTDRSYGSGSVGVFVRAAERTWVRGTFDAVEIFGPRTAESGG